MKRGLELIRRRLERVVPGEFIDSLFGIDELRNRWRSLPDYGKAPSEKKSGGPLDFMMSLIESASWMKATMRI
jgi:hypothetical protein